MDKIRRINGVYVRLRPKNLHPLQIKPVENEVDYIDVLQKKFHALMQKQIVNVLNNRPHEFNKELCHLIRNIADHYYSLGLKHMDQMHGKIDNQSPH